MCIEKFCFEYMTEKTGNDLQAHGADILLIWLILIEHELFKSL